MSEARKAFITEQRIYQDPQHPETSPYDVALPVTVPDAILDTEQGQHVTGRAVQDMLATAAGELFQVLRLVHDKAVALEGIILEATLTNTSDYPFNSSVTTPKTLALTENNVRNDKNYTVTVEAEAIGGGFIGDIIVFDKMTNGFKIAYTGDAKSVHVKCYVQGGR